VKHTTIIILLAIVGCALVHAQETVTILEAESAELTLPAKVKYVNGYSGNAYAGDNDLGSSIVFRNVNVPEEGTYEFRTYYTSMFQRSIAIQSGNYPKIIVSCLLTTAEWNKPPVAEAATYIYLNKGLNTLSIMPYGDGGPNIDKFEIITTSVSMPKPTPVNIASSYDLTDDAVVSTNRTSDNLTNLTDNTESSVYKFSGSSVDVKLTCDMPYLLTGYFLSSGLGNTEDIRNWSLEYSIDGNSYTTVSPTQIDKYETGTFFQVERRPHSDKNMVAKYYRLKAYGSQIGEIQLFGIPYLVNSDNKNFPEDITNGLNIQASTLGFPLGVSGTFDERYYNLFDRDMSRKYYWSGANSFWVDVELEKPVALNYYTLTSSQDYPERDPKSWEVQGFNTEWETVSEVTNFNFPTRYATMKFYVQNKKQYNGYRLKVTQNNGADEFQLLKWQLFADYTSSIPSVVDRIEIFSVKNEIVIRSQSEVIYQVVNLSGQLVATGKATDYEKRVSLHQGIYLVKLTTSGRTRIEKVIVK
jgi:hypothetical protein